MEKEMRVLGIETSCDETGVAVYDLEQGLLAHRLYSQVELHAQYGGVVPELASRDHIRKILPLVQEVLTAAETTPQQLNGIAYTAGPGLVGALLVGAAVGRSLAWGYNIPAVGVHHLEGHLLAAMLEDPAPKFPFLSLLVSGGHTQLIKVLSLGQYQILGESVDDAAGEAFDKTAKLLGLGYPGGAVLANLATQGDPKRFTFPRPMVNRQGLDFSFSGLKTQVMTTWKAQASQDEQTRADVARAFEDAVVDTLVIKCRRALQQTHLTRLVIAGGVGANQRLRQQLSALANSMKVKVFYPRPEFCTDNGAMIAYAGCCRLAAGERASLGFNATPRWALHNLQIPKAITK